MLPYPVPTHNLTNESDEEVRCSNTRAEATIGHIPSLPGSCCFACRTPQWAGESKVTFYTQQSLLQFSPLGSADPLVRARRLFPVQMLQKTLPAGGLVHGVRTLSRIAIFPTRIRVIAWTATCVRVFISLGDLLVTINLDTIHIFHAASPAWRR